MNISQSRNLIINVLKNHSITWTIAARNISDIISDNIFDN